MSKRSIATPAATLVSLGLALVCVHCAVPPEPGTELETETVATAPSELASPDPVLDTTAPPAPDHHDFNCCVYLAMADYCAKQA